MREGRAGWIEGEDGGVPTLVIRYQETERVVSFDAGSVQIGRSQSCEVVLADPKCSRRHAVLYTLDGCLALRDLGSRNGTWVFKSPPSSASTHSSVAG